MSYSINSDIAAEKRKKGKRLYIMILWAKDAFLSWKFYFLDQSLLFKLFDIRVETFLTIPLLPWLVLCPGSRLCHHDNRLLAGYLLLHHHRLDSLLSYIDLRQSAWSTLETLRWEIVRKYFLQWIPPQEMSGTLRTVTRETQPWRSPTTTELTWAKPLWRSTGSK